MTVTQLEPEIVVVEAEGPVRRLHPDGRKYRVEGGQMEVQSRWEGEQLVVESTRGRAGKLTETWSLAADKRQLTVHRHVDSPRTGTVTIKAVYDASAEAPSPPAAPPGS